MNGTLFMILIVPFIGTTLGSVMVLLMRREISPRMQRILNGFAAGVMVSASFWSLLIPAVEQAEETMGKKAILPTAIGFCLGILFLLLIDSLTPHMHFNQSVEGLKSKLKKTTMLVLAVVIHNIPEGMAVGVLCAGIVQGNELISFSAVLPLAFGIAIQNFPEGAIISMPLHANGMSRGKSFFLGMMSGVVEPIAGFLTILLASKLIPLMPILLSFAAGAMIYVVIEELIPGMYEEHHTNSGTLSFMVGFAGMMVLEIIFG